MQARGSAWLPYIVALSLAALAALSAYAQDTAETQELRERIEKLERQQPLPKASESAESQQSPGQARGEELPFRVIWHDGLVFTTPEKEWFIHVGGRINIESVWWQQPAYLKGPFPGNGGVPDSQPGAGVGGLQDGIFVRRARVKLDGTYHEFVEYNVEYNLENVNLISFDHLWAGVKGLPYLGTVRIGQQKVPNGLEMVGTDYHLTFVERSSLSDAFWTLFAPGIYVTNTYFDQRATLESMLYKVQPLQLYTSSPFGDGQIAAASRATWTPLYADEGEKVIHVGGSYEWRNGNVGQMIGGTGNTFADSQRVVRLRARPELRDSVGINPTLFGNPARFVDTGFLLGDSIQNVSPEFLTIWGPFSVQAEAAFARAENVQSIYPAAAFRTPRGDPFFWGCYAQASYFLTGEHRGYDRRFGRFDRPKVRQNFVLNRDKDGCTHFGCGAWELAYRYSYVDLNDNGINGGQLSQHTAGLNWYLNDNFKLQANYLNIQRNVASPAVSGTVHGFVLFSQWFF